MLNLAAFDLAPAITEILLACVALALLMVGVFRGSEPAAARLVMPLTVMAMVIGLFVLIVGPPRARRDLRRPVRQRRLRGLPQGPGADRRRDRAS